MRLLYDAGHSVTGADDPHLGDVHVVLLSHAHGDHMGDRKLEAQNAGTCGAPETIAAAPNSTTAEIAAAKNSAVVIMIPMASFIGKKIENVKGKPTGACPLTGSDLVLPLPNSCTPQPSAGSSRPESRTAAFVNLVKGRPVHLALSGKTLEFDENAKCVTGC